MCFATQELQDTNDYILGEYAALEREQNEIDERAAYVEKALRRAMEDGKKRDTFFVGVLKLILVTETCC